jgi:hypothetical protein
VHKNALPNNRIQREHFPPEIAGIFKVLTALAAADVQG